MTPSERTRASRADVLRRHAPAFSFNLRSPLGGDVGTADTGQGAVAPSEACAALGMGIYREVNNKLR